jgi:cytosine permease
MAANDLPGYIRSASPVPAANRAAWYKNTAPSYAGIFLWFAFYQSLGDSLKLSSVGMILLGIVIAGLICHFLFYFVPGMLGMRTGLPLYVVGTSTFGTKGGYFLPGIFMGLLQIGWYSVGTFFAVKLILNGLGMPAVTLYGPPEAGHAGVFDPKFAVFAVIWGYLFAFLGAKGISYVARMNQFFPIVPIVLLIVGLVYALPYLGSFSSPATAATKPAAGAAACACTWAGMLMIIQMIVGFTATAAAAGTDFCTNARNKGDVQLGGLVGIFVAIVFTAGLAMLTVAGAHGKNPAMTSWAYGDALEALSPIGGKVMLILFAIGSMAPACFCSFIIGNSLSTMLGNPNSRVPITLAGATIGIILAVTGVSANLAPYFGLIGASFGPVVGAMAADWFLSGRKWSGPRQGVNIAGYAAWLIGFLVGICNNGMVTTALGREILPGWHPTGVYSFVVGFIVYLILAGLRPPVIQDVVPTINPEAK